MRPRLHPDMGIVPISARIALQLAVKAYGRCGSVTFPAGMYPRLVLRDLPLEINGMLRLALHSLGVYLDLGYSSLQWLEAVLEASHFGHNFRRCFFFAYKEHRSPYPRVTNRGVQDSPVAPKSRVRKGRLNA